MKNLSLLLLFLSSFAFAQLSKDSIESIAKSYFEKTYVQKHFKDPYSYELKKMWSEPITKEETLLGRIAVLEQLLNSKAVPKDMKKGVPEDILDIRKNLSKMATEEKNSINAYRVLFDTYGANSYGNKILGRYDIIVSSDGKIGTVRERKD